MACAVVAAAVGLLPGPAWAEPEAISAASPQPRYGDLVAGLLSGTPAALAAGLALGPQLHVETSGPWRVGAELGWVRTTEYTQSWTVNHDEFRFRLTASAVRSLARAHVGLQLGAGITPLYESRIRAQAARISALGVNTHASAWGLYPGADLRAVVALPIWESWGIAVAVGPSGHLVDGDFALGWTGCVLAGWMP